MRIGLAQTKLELSRRRHRRLQMPKWYFSLDRTDFWTKFGNLCVQIRYVCGIFEAQSQVAFDKFSKNVSARFQGIAAGISAM